MTKTFTATLIDPTGRSERYTVDAENKTKARKEIARIYRQDTPSPRHGFYAFSQQRLRWEEEGE